MTKVILYQDWGVSYTVNLNDETVCLSFRSPTGGAVDLYVDHGTATVLLTELGCALADLED